MHNPPKLNLYIGFFGPICGAIRDILRTHISFLPVLYNIYDSLTYPSNPKKYDLSQIYGLCWEGIMFEHKVGSIIDLCKM